MDISKDSVVSRELLYNYFSTLVNSFFKILPIREDQEGSLVIYMQSLQRELLGCKELISAIQEDAQFLSLISILQYLINNSGCDFADMRREVFKAISICKKLQAKYAESGDVK